MQTEHRAPTEERRSRWRWGRLRSMPRRYRRAVAAGVATIVFVSAIAAGAMLGGLIPVARSSPAAEASGSAESPVEPSINGSATPTNAEAANTTSPSGEPAASASRPPDASPTPEPTEQPLVTWHVHDASAIVKAGGLADVVVDPRGRILSFFWGVDDWAGEPLEVGVLALDPATDTFAVTAPPLSSGGVGSDTYGLLGPDGLIYLFQWGPEDTSVSVFDPSADAWRPDEAATLEPGIGGGAVGGDGRIYVTRWSGWRPSSPSSLPMIPARRRPTSSPPCRGEGWSSLGAPEGCSCSLTVQVWGRTTLRPADGTEWPHRHPLTTPSRRWASDQTGHRASFGSCSKGPTGSGRMIIGSRPQDRQLSDGSRGLRGSIAVGGLSVPRR